jgi:hypothetical protein
MLGRSSLVGLIPDPAASLGIGDGSSVLDGIAAEPAVAVEDQEPLVAFV